MIQSDGGVDRLTDQENALENFEMDTTETMANNNGKGQLGTTMRTSNAEVKIRVDFPESH